MFKTQEGVYCLGSSYFPTGIALQALAQLGFQNELPVKKVFDAIIEWQNREIGGWCACDTDGAGIPGIRCTSVFLEALAEHPVLRNSEAAMFSSEYFRNIQNEDGTWGGGLFSCFYHLLDIVSRFDHPAALEQTVKAVPHILRKQRKDGTWGGKYRDLNTFTVVNALYRQSLLDLLRRGVNGT